MIYDAAQTNKRMENKEERLRDMRTEWENPEHV